MKVYEKLMDARIKMQGREIKKSGHNKFAGYYYMELGDFLMPAQEIFRDVGLCGVVSYTAEIATMTITAFEDGSQIVITSPMGSAALKGCHEVQNVGACETYQRRYLWMAALELVEHDSIDSSEPVKPEAPIKAAPRLINPPLKTANYEIQEARAFELHQAAQASVEQFENGDINAAWQEVSGVTDAEEKLYLWGVLKEFSALRKALKDAAGVK